MRPWRWLFLAPALLAAGCATPKLVPMGFIDCVDMGKPAQVGIALVRDGVRTVLPAEFQSFYPERARRLQTSGTADLTCVGVSGLPQSCQLVSETPADAEFGWAALKMSPRLPLNLDFAKTAQVRLEFLITQPPTHTC